jgi:hypothetical protein
MSTPTLDKKRFLDRVQSQRISNRKLWKLISTKELEEVEEFERLEQDLLSIVDDEEEDIDIDLPSLIMEPRFKQANRFAGSSPIPTVPETYQEISSKLVQKLFPKQEKTTVNGVCLKTEVTAYRTRITVFFAYQELELELSKTKQLFAKCKREKEDSERKQRKMIDEKVGKDAYCE